MATPTIMTTYGVQDTTCIHEAFRLLATKLGIESRDWTARLATALVCIGIFDISSLRARKLLPQQVDTFITQAGAPFNPLGWRGTIEHFFKVEFSNPEAPGDGKTGQATTLANCDLKSCNVRVSRFLAIGEHTLGMYMSAEGILDTIAYSPRTSGLIITVNVKLDAITKSEFRSIMGEQVLFTLKVYSTVNVDVIYLHALACKLASVLPNPPPHFDKKGNKLSAVERYQMGLFHKFNNARKEGAAVSTRACPHSLATHKTCSHHMQLCLTPRASTPPSQIIGALPRCDLTEKAIKLIEALKYPVKIVDNAPTAYPLFDNGTFATGSFGIANTDLTKDPVHARQSLTVNKYGTEAIRTVPAVHGPVTNQRVQLASGLGSGFRQLPPLGNILPPGLPTAQVPAQPAGVEAATKANVTPAADSAAARTSDPATAGGSKKRRSSDPAAQPPSKKQTGVDADELLAPAETPPEVPATTLCTAPTATCPRDVWP